MRSRQPRNYGGGVNRVFSDSDQSSYNALIDAEKNKNYKSPTRDVIGASVLTGVAGAGLGALSGKLGAKRAYEKYKQNSIRKNSTPMSEKEFTKKRIAKRAGVGLLAGGTLGVAAEKIYVPYVHKKAAKEATRLLDSPVEKDSYIKVRDYPFIKNTQDPNYVEKIDKNDKERLAAIKDYNRRISLEHDRRKNFSTAIRRQGVSRGVTRYIPDNFSIGTMLMGRAGATQGRNDHSKLMGATIGATIGAGLTEKEKLDVIYQKRYKPKFDKIMSKYDSSKGMSELDWFLHKVKAASAHSFLLLGDPILSTIGLATTIVSHLVSGGYNKYLQMFANRYIQEEGLRGGFKLMKSYLNFSKYPIVINQRTDEFSFVGGLFNNKLKDPVVGDLLKKSKDSFVKKTKLNILGYPIKEIDFYVPKGDELTEKQRESYLSVLVNIKKTDEIKNAIYSYFKKNLVKTALRWQNPRKGSEEEEFRDNYLNSPFIKQSNEFRKAVVSENILTMSLDRLISFIIDIDDSIFIHPNGSALCTIHLPWARGLDLKLNSTVRVGYFDFSLKNVVTTF